MAKADCSGGPTEEKELRKGPWTPAEDEILIHYVEKNGDRNWNSVQHITGLPRCGKSCRFRWINYLRPNLKKCAITPEEEHLILRLHCIYGNRWSRMAEHLPGRTDNEIKNYWNTRIKRMQRAGLPMYPTEILQEMGIQDQHCNSHFDCSPSESTVATGIDTHFFNQSNQLSLSANLLPELPLLPALSHEIQTHFEPNCPPLLTCYDYTLPLQEQQPMKYEMEKFGMEATPVLSCLPLQATELSSTSLQVQAPRDDDDSELTTLLQETKSGEILPELIVGMQDDEWIHIGKDILGLTGEESSLINFVDSLDTAATQVAPVIQNWPSREKNSKGG